MRRYSKPTAGYDPECEKLAKYFLQDEPLLATRSGELASRIQQVVEDWIEFEKGQLEAADPTTTEFLKPRGNGGVVNNEICYDALLLVGGTNSNLGEIACWSQEQRDRAYDWAMRVHLNASDNDDVLVPSRARIRSPSVTHKAVE